MATNWRRILCILHRDLGFLAVGLTLVYAISGVAVNHRSSWDYNRKVKTETRELGQPAALLAGLSAERRAALEASPASLTPEEQGLLVTQIANRLGKAAPRNQFWQGPDKLKLFLARGDDDNAEYQPSTGKLVRTYKRDRWVFRDVNFLHKNEPGKAWTWIADGFAGLLAFLALSGMIMVRGRHGLIGRGGIYVLVGIAIPIVALIFTRWK